MPGSTTSSPPVAPDLAPPIDPPAVAELVIGVARRLRHGFAAHLEPTGVTGAQARVIRILAGSGGPIRMGELAARLGVAPRSATEQVEALVEAGLVERGTDPADRRCAQVELTDAGRHRIVDLEAARAAAAEEVFGGIGADDRTRLAHLLAAVQPDDLCHPCRHAHHHAERGS